MEETEAERIRGGDRKCQERQTLKDSPQQAIHLHLPPNNMNYIYVIEQIPIFYRPDSHIYKVLFFKTHLHRLLEMDM